MELPENARRTAACLAERIAALPQDRRIILALDGRCAAGKTTLAAALAQLLPCSVFHMDDYFLRPEQRTAARFSEPGGNVDRERIFAEILSPLKSGAERVMYRPYSCATGALAEPITVAPARICVVEGSYSLHPALRGLYDARVFVTVSREEQLRRLAARSPEKLMMFQSRWIPMEETYFSACQVEACCDTRVNSETGEVL